MLFHRLNAFARRRTQLQPNLFAVLIVVAFGALALAEPKDKDRYAVPEGDVNALVQFIEELREYQPMAVGELLEYRRRGPATLFAASKKILELESDPQSAAYAMAANVASLTLLIASPKDMTSVAPAVVDYLQTKGSALTKQDENMGRSLATTLETAGETEAALKVYASLATIFSPSDLPARRAFGELCRGAARRLKLPGQSVEISGETVAGEAFDWESYRGKVVLIDFWATWCVPCVRELPQLKELYAQYHEQGFDVVGISLDDDPTTLREFLSSNEVPWTNLHHQESPAEHPVVKGYGVMLTPTTWLIGRDGKTISIKACGEELERLLKKNLQP